MAYFYFDFRNANKQGLRDLIPSLLTQLSDRSGPAVTFYRIFIQFTTAGKSNLVTVF
jgi:hypothetical protein